MTEEPINPPPPPARQPAPVQFRCTVLTSGTVIGKLTYGKGAVVLIGEARAKALASLTPPAVRIDGV